MGERRRGNVADTLRRFAGPSAFHPLVGLIVLVPLSCGTAFADISSASSQSWEWVGVAAASLAVGMAVFLFWGLALRRVRPGRVRSLVVAAAFGSVESLRAVFVELMSQMMGISAGGHLPFRIVAGFTTGVALISLASTLVGDAIDYRAEIRHMRDQEGKLRQLLSRSVTELASIRREILRDVRETVDTAIREVLRRSRKNASAQEVVDTLIEVSDGVIRPLSHELHDRPRVFPEPEPESGAPPRIRWRDALDHISSVAPFRPWATGLFGLLLLGPAMFFTKTLTEALLAAVATIGPMVVVLGLGALLARYAFSRIPLAWRIVIMCLDYIMMGLVAVSVLIATGLIVDLWVVNLPYAVGISVLIGWLLASPPGLRQANRDVLARTKTINDSLRWELARANARVWQEQQELSSVLHGDVQGSLLAAAFRLKSVIESGGDTVAAIDEVRTIVADSVEFVARPSGPQTLHAMVQDLTERWDGVLDVSVQFTGGTRIVVERDAVAMRAIRDLATEFATNSVKHGRAHEMMMSITVDLSAATVTLELVNDGRPLEEDRPRGLGSMLLDTLATKVSYDPDAQGVRIVAVLPTGPEAAPAPAQVRVDVP